MPRSLRVEPVRRVWRVALAFAVIAAPACAGTTPSVALIAAEDAYTRAVAGRDIAAIGQTLSDDLVYVHAAGQAQGKQDYLRATVQGGFAVRRAHVLERSAQTYGTIGITQGIIAYDVGQGEKPARYLAIYRKEGGRWLLLRWQNTRMPPLAPRDEAAGSEAQQARP